MPATASTTKFCFACGDVIDARAEICPECGVRQHAPPGGGLGAVTPSGKSRVVAALFAILLGGFGIHKFYLGKIIQGILYLLFCWTLIPSLFGIVEGIIYLVNTDAQFAEKYG